MTESLCAEAVLALGAIGAFGAGVARFIQVVLLSVSGPGVVAGDQLVPHFAGRLLVVGVAASHLRSMGPITISLPPQSADQRME